MQTLLCPVCKDCRNESIHFEQTAISNEELENCFNFFGPIFFWLVCIHKLNVWYHRRPPGCQFYSSDWFSFFWSICSIYIKYVVFFQFENDLPHNQTKSINWFWIIFDTGLGRSILIRVSCSYWPNAASLSSNDLTLFVDFGCRLFSKIADVFDFGNEIN